MLANEAYLALLKMEQTALVRRMIAVVEKTGKVPMWIEKEISYANVDEMNLCGNASGNAQLVSDNQYHGGYTE